LCHCFEEKPLEFEDIVDRITYDKMRPPKPDGKLGLKYPFISMLDNI